MQFNRMRSVDYYVGLFLCVILGITESIIGIFRKSPFPEAPRRIALIKWFGLGTATLMQPLLAGIRKKYPQAKIHFYTFSQNAELFKLYGLCDEVHIVRNDNFLYFCFDVLKELLRFGLSGMDITIDLEFYSKFSTFFSYFSGAGVRVGFYLPFFWRKSLITQGVYLNYYKSILVLYQEIGRAIKADMVLTQLIPVSASQAALRNVEAKLSSWGINADARLIGVNVNAGEMMLSRRWSKNNFAKVIEELIRSSGKNWYIVLTGAKSETGYTQEVYDLLTQETRARVFNIAGEFSVEDFICLLGKTEFFITNDSGPLHFAVAQGTRTISIWGPGTPFLYGPLDTQKHKIFYLGLNCSPCLMIYFTEEEVACKHEITCLKELFPQPIIDAAKEWMR